MNLAVAEKMIPLSLLFMSMIGGLYGCQETVYSLTSSDLYNGLDFKTEPEVDNDKNLLNEFGIYVTSATKVTLSSKSIVALTVNFVSVNLKNGHGALVDFLDSDDAIISTASLGCGCGNTYYADVKVSGVRSIVIHFITDASGAAIHASDLQVNICTALCASDNQVDSSGLFTIEREGTALENVEKFLKGSGGSIIAGTSPLMSAAEGTTVVLDYSDPAGYTVSSLSVETYQCKSLSVTMFTSEGKRRFRDTIVVEGDAPIVPVTLAPFAPPVEVAQIEVECRPQTDSQDEELDVALQNLEVILCDNAE